jgi:hypothetical protein
MTRPRKLMDAGGRRPENFGFSMSPSASADPVDLKRYHGAGVDDLYLSPVLQKPPGSIAELQRMLEVFTREWIEPASKL